jgi:Tol biopolymer transport system component
VSGNGGDDFLIAALGNDTLAGGAGSDILVALNDPDWEISKFQVASTLVSSDSLFAVFQTEANQFGYEAEPGQQAFFRLSLASGEIIRAVGPFDPADIVQLPGGGGPVLSGDGSVLALIGPATLANEPGSAYPQLLIADLTTGNVSVASRTPAGELAGYLPEALALSGDANTVAFVYLDSDLVTADSNGMRDIFIWQADSQTITLASVSATGTQADRPSVFPSLSADGRLLAFASAATNLTADSTGDWAVYVKDLASGELQRIASLANPSAFAFDIGPAPLTLSANGRFLGFVSEQSDLVESDTNGVADVFVHDLVSGETMLASEDFDGNQGQIYSDQPALSGDGRYAAFMTASTWPGALSDANFRPDVFVKDMLTGLLSRIPVPGADHAGTVSGSSPQLSFDGEMLIYHYGSVETVLALLVDEHVHTLQGGSGDDVLRGPACQPADDRDRHLLFSGLRRQHR